MTLKLLILAKAAVLFVVAHLGVSSTPLRARLVERFGEGPYLGLYSLGAFATLGLLVWAWLNARAAGVAVLWLAPPWLAWLPVVLMAVALVLLVGGLVRNPTSVGQHGTLGDPDVVRGVLRITRHPVQWAILLWAVSHLLVNGDVGAVLFFGAFAVLSGVGMLALDRKKARQAGAAWAVYRDATSVLPFGAVLGGRNRVVWREMAFALVLGLGLWVLLLYVHPWIAGVGVAVPPFGG